LGKKSDSGRLGRVVETRGRRVRVRDDEGVRDCFLAGNRVVVGDVVRYVDAPGEGGKVTAVEPRTNALRRMDPRGREQILAANLGGLLIVASVRDPDWRAALVHRYFAAADRDGLDAVLMLTKTDLGVPEIVEAHVALIAPELDALRVSVRTGDGLAELAGFLSRAASEAPWALVGGSGVGKTSLASALLPGEEVGAIGDISEYWGTGRHTTTESRCFTLPGGGEIVDSPGIRNLTPAFGHPDEVRDHFPVVRHLRCQYRDCRHRPGESGCLAEAGIEPGLLDSYRTLLSEVEAVER